MLRKFVRTSPVLEVWIGGRCIETTSEHPFFVVGRAVQQSGEENLTGWLPAAWLRAGDLLLSHAGQLLPVEAVADPGRVTTVYNLQVEDAHTYFVGSSEWGFSVWAHNAGPECGGKGPEGLSGEAKKNHDADQDTSKQKNASRSVPNEINFGRAGRVVPDEINFGRAGRVVPDEIVAPAAQGQTTRVFTATEGPVNLGRPGTGAINTQTGLPTPSGAGGTFVTPTDIANPAALELHIQRSLPAGTTPRYVAEIEVPTQGLRADPTGDLRPYHRWVAPDTAGARIVRMWEITWVDDPRGFKVPTFVEVPVGGH